MRLFFSNFWKTDNSKKIQRHRIRQRVVQTQPTQKVTHPSVPEYQSLSDFRDDPKWRELSQWGKELGVSSWTSKVVLMPSIHRNLLMGSRLSVQNLIDGEEVVDQFKSSYNIHNIQFLCAASEKTCRYCDFTNKGVAFNLRDRDEQDSAFLANGIEAAFQLHRMLARSHVLVHCHSGRNRSALVILLYAALFTHLEYDEAVSTIKNYNASRFPRESTLKNSSFTRIVKINWKDIRERRNLTLKRTAYGNF